jgi:hypothetical protein
MENLTAFLSRREILDTIGAYINEDDHRIIAAIALLDEPVPAELEGFFAGEYSCVELHGMLLNLEERFIVYRFREEENYRVSLNPLLEPVLSPFIADRSVLFPSLPGDEDPGQTVRHPLDDRILAALISFVTARKETRKEFFKSGGGIRKKIIDDGRQIFPNLDIGVLVDGLYRIGLLGNDGARPVPEMRRLEFFGKLSFRERLEYLAAGIYADPKDREAVSRNAEAGSWYLHRGWIQSLARFIRRIMGFLDYGRLYPRQTLFRLVEILEREYGVIQNESRPLSPEFAAGETGRLLSAMETAGLLRAVPENSGGTVYAPRDTVLRGPPVQPDRPVIAMDTPFSCILYPEIGFSAAVTLASFCECRETGATVRFELTRESVVRGFNQGFTAEDMTGILERLSLGAPDQNLCWTVKEWENRYSAVSLFQGTVLTLSEDRRYLAETGMLSPLICRTLAPGVYLLAVSGKDEAVRILQKAGVDIIAQPPSVLPAEGGKTAIARSPYPPTGGFGVSGPGAAASFSTTAEVPAGIPAAMPAADSADREKVSGEQKERFLEALRKSGLPKADQDELAARIERRQIVSESQLTGGSARHEKLEARNLDYVGKTIVARQAIASGSLVEVLLPSADGEENRILGTPLALEKSGGETVLLLRPLGRDGAGGEKPEPELKIPLGKIRLLRWIKQSIFTQ